MVDCLFWGGQKRYCVTNMNVNITKRIPSCSMPTAVAIKNEEAQSKGKLSSQNQWESSRPRNVENLADFLSSGNSMEEYL